MSNHAGNMTPVNRLESIKSLESLLDYAMLEGAELKLPMLVFLLRVASQELLKSMEAERGAHRAGDDEKFDELRGNRSPL